jgi:CotH kinase protein
MLNSRARSSRELCCGVLVLVLGCEAGGTLQPDAPAADAAAADAAAAEADAAAADATDAGPEVTQPDADAAPPEPEGLDFEPSDLDPPAPPGDVHAEPADEASYLFDPSVLRTYELRLSPEALETLDGNAQLEQYVEGSLIFEGQEYAPIGIRYKGSIGSWRGCIGGLRKTCTKLSMKIKLDYDDPDGNLLGLRKLMFHSMNNDPSMLKERLGYWLFRAFGVPAPRAVHARLLINGQLNGLVAVVEDVDGRFTRSRFAEGGKGNLYKEAWPVAADGTAITAAALLPKLETNEDDDPSLERFVRFGKLLQHASERELAERLEHWLSLDHVMRYLAVDRATGNDDGVMHWYCLGNPCWNHNFFWYEERDAQRFWLIPWDLDSSFNRDNAITTIWLPWDDTELDCQPTTMAPFNLPLRAPSCDRLIRAWAGLDERYGATLAAFLHGPYRADAVEPLLGEWETQIAPVVAEAAALHADAVSVEAWQAAGQRLREAIAELRQRAQQRIEQAP